MLAVDVGGTFTDFVLWDEGRLRTAKVSTSDPQSDAVVDGASELLQSPATTLLHGTTAATNALLQRRGARIALITNRGAEDLVEIARQDRPSLYDVSTSRAEPLVSRGRRFGVAGRIDHRGREITGLQQTDSERAAVVASEPGALAISLLNSYANPLHEETLGRWMSERLPGIPISLSSQVTAEFREYERTATTTLNSYLIPAIRGYLSDLEDRMSDGRLAQRVLVMRSSGGLLTVEKAADLPAAIVLSGPAGGAVAAASLAQAHEIDRVISLDMGGTSTDVTRIDGGRPTVGYEREVAGLPCRLPSIAINTVGAGGGSIAWSDAGAALRVGPQSAGARPGPAVYGRGGHEPTVTDAHVVLGSIGSEAVLGGTIPIEAGRGGRAVGKLSETLGITPDLLARGIIEITDSRMERAIRAVSIEEGVDPRPAYLIPFGGAGPLHAVSLAQRLGMEGVLIPPFSGVFSALGLLLSPLRADAAQTVLLFEPPMVEVHNRALEQADAALAQLHGMGAEGASVELLADLRYRGQSHETTVRIHPSDRGSDLFDRFHTAHEERNGFARRGDPVEVVTLRAAATAASPIRWTDVTGLSEGGEPRRGTREVIFREGPAVADVLWRPALGPESRVAGPAILEEPHATALVPPGSQGVVRADGSVEVTW